MPLSEPDTPTRKWPRFVPAGFVTIPQAVERVAMAFWKEEWPTSDISDEVRIWHEAAAKLRNALASELMTSVMLLDASQAFRLAGELIPLGAKHWRAEYVDHVFGRGSGGWGLAQIPDEPLNRTMSGWALIEEKQLVAFLEGRPAATPAKTLGPVGSDYVPPYIAYMLRAVLALGLSAEERVTTNQIKHWLRQNWPRDLGLCSDKKLDMMATFLRTPEQAKGGNLAVGNKARPAAASRKRPKR